MERNFTIELRGSDARVDSTGKTLVAKRRRISMTEAADSLAQKLVQTLVQTHFHDL